MEKSSRPNARRPKSEKHVIEVRDVGSENTVKIHYHFTDGKRDLDSSETYGIPEEYMGLVDSLIGDGLARVSVGTEVKTSDFGNAASGHVTVTLTCNQSDEAIGQALGIAGDIALRAAEAIQQKSDAVLQGILSGRGGAPAEAPKQMTVKPPPAAKEFRVATKVPTKLPIPAQKKLEHKVASPGASARAPGVVRIGDATKKPSFKKM